MMSEADRYESLEKIGHGSFGIIRKVKRKSDGHVMCRKEINYIRMSNKEREQLHAEFSILNSLHHPNIVGYYHREHLKATQDLHLYMEYCGNGDLGQYIKKLKATNQYADEPFVWSMFSQLVTALYRCHYGEDPPEVGQNVFLPCNQAKSRPLDKGKIMILHRDLKPENVFLGEDNSVKLGDFGLSKIMRSHDFASTYVGTPFYMSPEICAAERYTLRSDIWSLGCIIYELCARDPPFNATTHFNLVNKIKVGKYPDLPAGYSPELQEVIRKCLRVNPNTRPDTASLLDLPIVRLVRKEKEVVALGKVLATKESKLDLQIKQAEEQLNSFEAEKQNKTQEVESSVRREWEVKARLEIDKHIQREKMRLTKEFETEVRSKVELELSKPTSSKEYDIPQSSVSTNDDAEFPSTTDLTSLSLESPTLQKSAPLRKSTRTPFGRAQTMFVGSPMDIQMAEPSPMSIASLSLSPRRNGAGPGTDGSKNIFTIATDKIDNDRWQGTLAYSTDEGEDEDDLPLPSPTRQKPASKNPFNKPIRPTLVSQKTAPQKPNNQPSIFSKPQAPTTSGHSDTQKPAPEKKTASPSRRLSKIPSSTSLVPVSPDRGSPVRRSKSSRALLTNTTNLPPSAAATTISDDLAKQVTKGNMMKGRTLLELAQARAGGRPVSSHGLDSDSGITKRKGLDFKGRMDALTNKLEAPTWDPERDEMPSPFLDRRGGRGIRGGF